MRLAAAAERVRANDIEAALQVMMEHPSPRGHEHGLAVALAGWARRRWPELHWEVERVGEHGANLMSRARADAVDTTLVYSHLDTSLTGSLEWDSALTGRTDEPAPWSWDEAAGVVSGFGLGVAKGPAAAAIVGYAAAVTHGTVEPGGPGVALLLAGSGTHRSPFEESPVGLRSAPTGVEAYLASGRRPASVVVAKCGPPGVLHHEPGALFLKIRLGAAMVPAMHASSISPPGGLPLSIGPALEALGRWREEHLAARSATGPIAPEVGIGSIVAGRPGKPDLLPACVEIHAYVVLIGGDDPERIRASVQSAMQSALDRSPLVSCPVQVLAALEHPAAGTPASAPIVQQAAAAWAIELGGEPAPVVGWKGSTDGVVFRGAGCDTVRMGPGVTPSATDVRVDQIAISDLVKFSRIYARLALHALRYSELLRPFEMPSRND